MAWGVKFRILTIPVTKQLLSYSFAYRITCWITFLTEKFSSLLIAFSEEFFVFLHALISANPTRASEKLLPLLLTNYGATTTKRDQAILKVSFDTWNFLLRFYIQRASVRQKRWLAVDCNFNTTWRKRRTTTPFYIVILYNSATSSDSFSWWPFRLVYWCQISGSLRFYIINGSTAQVCHEVLLGYSDQAISCLISLRHILFHSISSERRWHTARNSRSQVLKSFSILWRISCRYRPNHSCRWFYPRTFTGHHRNRVLTGRQTLLLWGQLGSYPFQSCSNFCKPS